MYTYKAKIIAVYDGDTVTALIDCGFHIQITEKLRFLGINAPEMRGVEKIKGKASRDFLRGLVLNKEVTIKTKKDKKGKYGRYLAKLFINTLSINDYMVQEGYAVYKDY